MSWYGLWKPVPGEVIRTVWGQKVVEALDVLYSYTAGVTTVIRGGYVVGDLVPDKDLIYKVGTEDARFREVHAGYGYFTYDLFRGDKRVLADGDPIYISDIYPEAQARITTAINNAYATDYLASVTAETKEIRTITQSIEARVREIEDKLSNYIYPKLTDIEARLLELESKGVPKLLGLQVSYLAPDFGDIFSPDLEAQLDGRVRIKIMMESGGYAYVKWVPSGTATSVIGLLNAVSHSQQGASTSSTSPCARETR